MFYSHEILTSTQYGVATIWLVATIGKTNQKRLTKRAIQGVDLPRACKKIIDPGPPLALRLQSNLLYGVSRVFSHQCNYVLSDAEKTQSDMMTFFRSLKTSETDAKAGQAKKSSITLGDDPNFDPMTRLPSLDFANTDLGWLIPSQGSASKFSQMTPLDQFLERRQSNSSLRRNSHLTEINLPSSSHSPASYGMPVDLYDRSSPFPKGLGHSEELSRENQFPDDRIPIMDDIGFDFDGDGNLIGVLEPEPELPPLPGLETPSMNNERRTKEQREQHGNDDLAFLDESLDQNAEPFSLNSMRKRQDDSFESWETQNTEEAQSQAHMVAPKRKKAKKANVFLDENTNFNRTQHVLWSQTYREDMQAARKERDTTASQAKKNAAALMFGDGVGNIGILNQSLGFKHPLAEQFSGPSFKAVIHGEEPNETIEEGIVLRGRRRKSDEAFEEQEEEALGRNVKQRPESEVGRGVAAEGDGLFGLGEDMMPEIGMFAAPPLDDHHSSSVMPWSRQGSVAPGSSVKGPGSAQKSLTAPSPLQGKGSALGSIHRYSDPLEPSYASVDFQTLGSLDDSLVHQAIVPNGIKLDQQGQDFLQYAVKTSMEENAGAQIEGGRRWIDFERLAAPGTHDRSIAAQAFLNVLSLATKNVVKVDQDGRDHGQAFGSISIGLHMRLE